VEAYCPVSCPSRRTPCGVKREIDQWRGVITNNATSPVEGRRKYKWIPPKGISGEGEVYHKETKTEISARSLSKVFD